MSAAQVKSWMGIGAATLMAILGTGIPDALGAEGPVTWRPIYDLAMRWLNFGILVFLFFRYARKPLISFLKGQANQIAENIQNIEAEKEAVEARVKELLAQQAESRQRFKVIEERIISHGELKKQKIIENAHDESRLLLENAKRRMAFEIRSARQKLRDEIVDLSIDLAIQKLPQQITDQDAGAVLQSNLEDIRSIPRS